ncbi:MAG: hypothetical protein ABJX32_17850 [Tateyamaria sp.]|uniref:hypothetical protein n=1 Tax=Tateyamaria sp. TaxID=1929288 RepID=UPI00329E86DE
MSRLNKRFSPRAVSAIVQMAGTGRFVRRSGGVLAHLNVRLGGAAPIVEGGDLVRRHAQGAGSTLGDDRTSDATTILNVRLFWNSLS